MTRTERRGLLAVVLGACLVIAVLIAGTPAQADHVTEPTQPVAGVAWRVFDYPQGALQACGPLVDAGADPYVFDSDDGIRMELDVENLSQDPSEHMFGRLVFSKVEGTETREFLRRQWDVLDRHWNVPAHSRRTFEVWQTNVYSLDPGTYEVFARVEGLASGDVHEAACRFDVVG